MRIKIKNKTRYEALKLENGIIHSFYDTTMEPEFEVTEEDIKKLESRGLIVIRPGEKKEKVFTAKDLANEIKKAEETSEQNEYVEDMNKEVEEVNENLKKENFAEPKIEIKEVKEEAKEPESGLEATVPNGEEAENEKKEELPEPVDPEKVVVSEPEPEEAKNEKSEGLPGPVDPEKVVVSEPEPEKAPKPKPAKTKRPRRSKKG